MTTRAVFCDFDGTITANETFAEMLQHFAPERAAEILPQVLNLKLTIREGVRAIMESIPSARYPEMIEFVRPAPVRPGFAEFVAALQSWNVPLVLVSGGLRGLVEAVLGEQLRMLAGVYAVEADHTGPTLRVYSPFEGETELMAKVEVTKRHPAQERVAIGDSVTDLNLAQAVEVVFARDRLARILSERGVPFLAWEDFHDVRRQLAERWGYTP